MSSSNSSTPKLLREYATFDYKEDDDDLKVAISDKSKPMVLKGVIQRCNTLNQNGRVYPRDILLREIENYQQIIKEKRAFGCLDHANDAVVAMQDVSHMITKLWVEEDAVYGEVRILDNPKGQVVRSIVEAGGRPGISSRAVGSIKKESINSGPGYQKYADIVQEDLQIICWDIVSEPSTPGAYLALTEAKELSQEQLREFKNTSFYQTRDSRISRSATDLLSLRKKL